MIEMDKKIEITQKIEIVKSESKDCEPIATDVSRSLNEVVSFLPQKHRDDALENITDYHEDPRNFILPISKKYKIRIYKPLILLKIALFIWYGAGSSVFTFIYVFFKQKGISVTELATIFVIVPYVQFLGPMISGIIADKIGSSKPVLIVILLLNAILMIGIVVAPDMNVMKCDTQSVNLECHQHEFGHQIAETNCDGPENATQVSSCNETCHENISEYCTEQNLMCNMLKLYKNEINSTVFEHRISAYKSQNKCYYNISSISLENTTYSICTILDERNCSISCLINASEKCFISESGRNGIVILNTTILILFLAVFSTTYRIMDVTAMSLVQEHNSDFGRQRFFSMLGAFVFSIFSGYLVTAFAVNKDDKNYKTGLYCFVGMVFILLAVIYKLKVQVKPPGKNMWKKSLYLLKKPDVIALVLVLIVLGSACGFKVAFLYWYLEGLGTSSFMLGLLNGLGSLYGLPFLFTSNWWVKTVGTRQLIILALLGYVAQGIGYSLLYDPWLAVFIQLTTIVTYHLLWVAVIVHCQSIAPTGLTATVISTSGGIHFNLGKGAGSFVGGYIMNAFGGRMAFTAMAVACSIAAVLYAVYFYVRRKVKKMYGSVPTQEYAKDETELKCSTLCTGI